MKKISMLLLIMVFSMSSTMMYGCGKEEKTVQETEEVQEEEKKEPENDLEDEKSEENEEDVIVPEIENDEEDDLDITAITKMKIYYADPGSGDVISKEVETDTVTPKEIWEQLQTEGVLSEECGLNQYTFHEAEKKIDLDVNSDFGVYIRGMGTAGEDIVLTCITRSYLETFGYEGIKITEDGKVLETGHAVLDGYMETE